MTALEKFCNQSLELRSHKRHDKIRECDEVKPWRNDKELSEIEEEESNMRK